MFRLSVSCRFGSAAVALLAMTAASCAARQPRSMADRFIRQADSSAEAPPDLMDLLPRVDEDQAVPGTAPVAATRSTSTWSDPADDPDWPDVEVRSKLVQGLTAESQNADLAAALDAHAAAPSSATALAVAEHYNAIGVFDAAHSALTSALDKDARNPVLLEARARVWRDWGLPGFGLGDAVRAVYFEPDWAGAHNTRGTLLFLLGQSEAARDSFEAARQLAPDAAYILSNLCFVEADLGNNAAAAQHCDAALALDPTLATALANRKALGGGGE